jgi:deoxycytidylate deaminase
MAFTASTTTLKKSTLDFIGTLTGTSANKFVFYVQYTKGDETSINLAISFIKIRLSASTQFKSSPLDTATVAQQVFTITGSQNVRIPVTVSDEADSIVAALGNTGGTPTGTVVVDGFPCVSYA